MESREGLWRLHVWALQGKSVFFCEFEWRSLTATDFHSLGNKGQNPFSTLMYSRCLIYNQFHGIIVTVVLVPTSWHRQGTTKLLVPRLNPLTSMTKSPLWFSSHTKYSVLKPVEISAAFQKLQKQKWPRVGTSSGEGVPYLSAHRGAQSIKPSGIFLSL